MKKFFSTAVLAVLAFGLAACATPAAAPSADQVAKIETACAIDAGIRPTVSALLAIPGLATVAEAQAIQAARGLIDPVCANPSAPVQQTAIAAVTGASAQIVGIVAQLQARRSTSQ